MDNTCYSTSDTHILSRRGWSVVAMKTPRSLILTSIALGVVAWAAGCGDDTTEPPPRPEPPRPAAITVTPAMAELTALGETVQLSAEVRDQNGQVMDGVTVTWASSAAAVAKVDAAGLVTALGNGAATITATAGAVSGSAAVTVAQEVRGVEVLPPADTVSAGDTLRLTAEAWDPNGFTVPGIEFTWSSSDAAIATVDGSGLVSGIAEGAATITAASPSVQGTAGITVAHPDWTALVALYEATQGAGWIENDGWMSDRPIGQWHGVTTGESGRVTAVRLYGHNLIGSIPPDLTRLSHLETLNLERNTLAGPIPTELGNLDSLKTLILGVNRLSGRIPSELGNLANLQDLRLRRNNLTGPIPPELSNLRNLTRLGLNQNLLTGPIPRSFLRLERLQLFHFADNRNLCISGSADFADWLTQLDVYVGPFCNEGDREALVSLHGATGGPDWDRSTGWLGDGILDDWHGVSVGSLGRVTTLDLSDNGLAGRVPESLAQLTNMTSLRIDGNEDLSGPLPLSLSALSLQELQYKDTGLCIPPDGAFGEWLAAIPSHEGTNTNCQPLSEREILESLYDATAGADWADDDNWLSDRPLGEWYGVETNDQGRVVALRLPDNNLAGRMPPQLGNLGQLRELALARNRLSGPIPPQLGNLSSLSRLDLNGNQLTGSIPSELGNLSNLSTMYLYWNGLTGPIPSELGNLSNLMTLGLGLNGLTGPIPPELGNLSNLSALYLDWNGLTGRIPSELGNLSRLSQLILSENRLTGSIPAWLGNLSGLARLSLSGNELTGRIPAGLGSLPSLSELSLSGNRLTGSIPAGLGNLSSLARLDLSGNELTGGVPSELGNLSGLSALYLDGNELTGPIPPEFGGLSGLRLVSIKDNRLSGSLPPQLGDMANLRRLYLIDNAEMSGTLPSSLTALGKLNELLLTGTGLCAPGDAGFQSWLSDVKLVRVRLCGAGTASSAYLTQAVQSLDFPVPLVAGKAALLRVFVTASRATSDGIPKVRATFYVDGVETHAVDIAGAGTAIPTTVEDAESVLEKSANARIPGSVIQPGLEMVIEIDPDSTLDPELGVTKRIPETGRAPVQVEVVPVLDLTVVPFQRAQDSDTSIVDIARGMAADPQSHEMLWDSRTFLPIGDLDVKAHESVLTSTTNVVELLLETQLIRRLEGGTGYHMGIMPERVVGGESGVAYLGGHVGFSVSDPFVIAHELGHNLSLSHAPCGGAGGPDRAFPQSDGSIGAWGYDPRGGGMLISPRARDLMSYCGPPRWVSDYSFTKALDHRVASANSLTTFAQPAVHAPTRALLLWGGVDEQGDPFLEPAFVADAPPNVPRSPGAYELVGRTASGDALFSLSFDMMEMADADGRSSFVFALPVRTEWADVLESIALSGPAGSTTMDQATDQPMAILRDPDSGQVRGILRGEDATDLIRVAAEAAGLTAPRLRVLFSRGMPDVAEWRP